MIPARDHCRDCELRAVRLLESEKGEEPPWEATKVGRERQNKSEGGGKTRAGGAGRGKKGPTQRRNNQHRRKQTEGGKVSGPRKNESRFTNLGSNYNRFQVFFCDQLKESESKGYFERARTAFFH